MSFACSNCSEPINSRQHKQSGLCLICRKRKNASDRKEAEKKYKQQYDLVNKAAKIERTRRWQSLNKDRINARRRELNKERYKNDVNFKLKCILRTRLREAIKFSHRAGSAVRDLGCSIEYFKGYLESKFHAGMSWDNWKSNDSGWQIDHIVPLCRFDLSRREELLKACHYTNLQPLWGQDHKEKTVGDLNVIE